jgi:hypothetical protein
LAGPGARDAPSLGKIEVMLRLLINAPPRHGKAVLARWPDFKTMERRKRARTRKLRAALSGGEV